MFGCCPGRGVASRGHHYCVRTIGRWLQRLGISRRHDLDPTGENNRHSGKIIARFPGHMLHLDVKKVGQIPAGGGWRLHGRGSTRTRHQRVGYTYLHSAIDGYLNRPGFSAATLWVRALG